MPNLLNENAFCTNFMPLSFVGFPATPARLKRHFGTFASRTPHFRTCVEVIKIPIPPPQSSDFRIIACGDEAKSSKSINETESNWSSAGRRLVVVKKCNVLHSAKCSGGINTKTSPGSPPAFTSGISRGLVDED